MSGGEREGYDGEEDDEIDAAGGDGTETTEGGDDGTPPVETTPAATPPTTTTRGAGRDGRAAGATAEPTVPAPAPTPRRAARAERAPAPTPPTRSPFYRNIVNSMMGRRETPATPSVPLEREQNYSKAEEITKLINKIRTGEFEREMRDKRYKEMYGNDSEMMRELRSHLDGSGHWEQDIDPATGTSRGMVLVDSDFDYDRETGTLEYNAQHAFLRRTQNVLAKVGVKGLITGGIGLAIGLLTGPAGMAAISPMMLRVMGGSAIGRAGVEIARSFDRTEREDREKLEIADIRYYQKTTEIGERAATYRDNHPRPADLVAGTPAGGALPVGTSPTGELLYNDVVRRENITIEEWDMRQAQATKDLVNLVYSYEQNEVEVVYDQQGRPMVHPTGTPPPLGTARPEGTEVIQPSNVAPDKVLIGDLRTAVEERRQMWESRGDLYELVVGGAWTGLSLLNGGWSNIVGHAFESLKNHFASGEAIKNIDINGDLVTHTIQRTKELGDIYHLGSVGENLATAAAGAAPLTVEGAQFGAHTLGETAARIDLAFLHQASLAVGAQLAGAFAALGAKFGISNAINNVNHENSLRDRAELVHNYEMWRERLQPDSLLTQMKARAESLHKDFPAAGERWVRIDPVDPDADPDLPPTPPARHYYKISEVLENGSVRVVDLDDPDHIVIQLRLADMIDPANGYHRVMRSSTTRTTTTAPGTPGTPGAAGPDGRPGADGRDGTDGGGGEDSDDPDEEEEDEIITPDGTPEAPETPPETERVPGELLITPETYTHVDDAIGRRLETGRVSHEFFRTAEVKGNHHMIVAIDHKTKDSALRDERLLENISNRIVELFDAEGNVTTAQQDSMQAIANRALTELVHDAAERNNFGMTLTLTLPNGQYYGLWINNTRETTDDAGVAGYQHVHQIRVSDTAENQPRYAANETRCHGRLSNGERLMLLGNAFDHESTMLDEIVKRRILTSTAADLSARIQQTYDEFIAANEGHLPQEFNAVISEYKETASPTAPDDETASDTEVEKTKPKKKERILTPEEEALKKSKLPWAEVLIQSATENKTERKIINIESGQIFHTTIKGKDIFYEISKDPKNPNSIFAKDFGLNKKDEVVKGSKTFEFDSMDKFRKWLEASKAIFAAKDMASFEEMIEKEKLEKAKTP